MRGDFPAFNNIRPLLSREKIDYLEGIKDLFADSVDTTNSLDYPHRIPGNVIIDNHLSPVQIESFGELIGSQKNIIFIFLLGLGIGCVKIGVDFLQMSFTDTSRDY